MKTAVALRLSFLGLTLLALVLAGGLSLRGTAEAQEAPQQVTERFIRAVNAGDIDGAVATLADNVKIISPDCQMAYGESGCSSRAQFREILRLPTNKGGNIKTLSVTVAGFTVIYRAEHRAPALIPPPFNRFATIMTFRVENGLIAEVTLELDMTDAETVAIMRALTAPPIAAPSTGDGGLVQERRSSDPPGVLALAAASLVVAAAIGALAQRLRTRSRSSQ